MVRKKNVLATMAQSAAATVIVSLLWFAAGYSLSFTGDGSILGAGQRLFMAGAGLESVNPPAKTIPEMLFMSYQMTFAVIVGAGCRSHEIFRFPDVLRNLAVRRLRAPGAHGLGCLSPFDLSLAVVGTGLLWVGWFGFNGGSALASARAPSSRS
jgi:Amt family ammonium transporter